MAGTLLTGLRKRLARCRTGVGMWVRPQLLAPGPSDGLAPGAEKVGRHHPPLQPVPRGGRSGVGPGPWPSLTSAHLCQAPCPRPGRTESLVTVEQGNPRLGVGRPLQPSRARPCFHPSDLWLGARSELRHPSPVGCPPRAHVAAQPLTARTACSRQELVSPPAEQDSSGSFCDPAPSDLP